MGARLRALRTNDQTVLIRPKVDLIAARERSKYDSAYDLSHRVRLLTIESSLCVCIKNMTGYTFRSKAHHTCRRKTAYWSRY